MHETSASLQPVRGSSREVWVLVQQWYSGQGGTVHISTSGSTGEPKLIRLGRSALLASAAASLERLGGPGRWLLALPVTGVGGFQVLVRSVLADTEPVFLEDHEDLELAISAMKINDSGRSYVSLVPTQLHRLAESGKLSLLADFDAVLIGGAASSPELLQQAAEAGVNIVRTYGMTETCGGCVYDGVPLDDVQMRIENDGRISLSGPVLFDGAPQWWTTNDLGRINTEGKLEVIGRADQVAVSGGVNVPLAVVENTLAAIPGVAEIVVVAREDAEWGQAVTAIVRGALDRDSARAALEAAGYPRSWTPRVIEIVNEFPLLPSGKIDRQGLVNPSI